MHGREKEVGEDIDAGSNVIPGGCTGLKFDSASRACSHRFVTVSNSIVLLQKALQGVYKQKNLLHERLFDANKTRVVRCPDDVCATLLFISQSRF